MADGTPMTAASAVIKVALDPTQAYAQLSELKSAIQSTTGSLGAAQGGGTTTTGVPMPARGGRRARGPRVPSVVSSRRVSAGATQGGRSPILDQYGVPFESEEVRAKTAWTPSVSEPVFTRSGLTPDTSFERFTPPVLAETKPWNPSGTRYREADMRSSAFIGRGRNDEPAPVLPDKLRASLIRDFQRDAQMGGFNGGESGGRGFQMRYMWHAFTVAFLARMVGEGISSVIQSAGTASVDRSFLSNVGNPSLAKVLRNKAYIQQHNSAFMNLVTGRTYRIAQMQAELPVRMAHLKADAFYNQTSAALMAQGVSNPSEKSNLSNLLKYYSERSKINQTPMDQSMRQSLISQNQSAYWRSQYQTSHPFEQEKSIAWQTASVSAAGAGFGPMAKILSAQGKMADAIDKTVSALHPFIHALEQAQVAAVYRQTNFAYASSMASYKGQDAALRLQMSGHRFAAAAKFEKTLVAQKISAFNFAHQTDYSKQIIPLKKLLGANNMQEAHVTAQIASEEKARAALMGDYSRQTALARTTHLSNLARRQHNEKITAMQHAKGVAIGAKSYFMAGITVAEHGRLIAAVPLMLAAGEAFIHQAVSEGRYNSDHPLGPSPVENIARTRAQSDNKQIAEVNAKISAHLASLKHLNSAGATFEADIQNYQELTGLNKNQQKRYAHRQGLGLQNFLQDNAIKKAQFMTALHGNLAASQDMLSGNTEGQMRQYYQTRIKEANESKLPASVRHAQVSLYQTEERTKQDQIHRTLKEQLAISQVESSGASPYAKRIAREQVETNAVLKHIATILKSKDLTKSEKANYGMQKAIALNNQKAFMQANQPKTLMGQSVESVFGSYGTPEHKVHPLAKKASQNAIELGKGISALTTAVENAARKLESTAGAWFTF